MNGSDLRDGSCCLYDLGQSCSEHPFSHRQVKLHFHGCKGPLRELSLFEMPTDKTGAPNYVKVLALLSCASSDLLSANAQ